MPAKKPTPAPDSSAPAAKKAPAKKAAAKKAPARKTAAAKPAAETVAPKAAPKPVAKPAPAPSHDEIAREAYLNYRSRKDKGIHGDAHGDWLDAEKKLKGK
jgi:hypothetical protein